ADLEAAHESLPALAARSGAAWADDVSADAARAGRAEGSAARAIAAVASARITAIANAMPTFSAPGLPRRRNMSVGRVCAPGRARNADAPNSPSETAAHSPAAMKVARRASGHWTVRHTRAGPAPSVAA